MRIYELEKTTKVDRNNTYIRSYPAMIKFFADKRMLTPDDVIVGMHMVYGWMPRVLTIQEIDVISLVHAAEIINEFRQLDAESYGYGSLGHYPDINNKLDLLKKKFNNSIVGVSKFLHFMRPDIFPIYDSKVNKYLRKFNVVSATVNTVENYMIATKIMSQACCHTQKDLVRYEEGIKSNTDVVFHASVQEKVGYPISAMRAVELMMFLNSDTEIADPFPSL